MKKKLVSTIILAITIFLGSSTSNAATSSHTNMSSDNELWPVTYSAAGVLVTFAVTGTLQMEIRVDYPGKIIGYESIYATIPSGTQFPFDVSLTADTIKYYKDDAYLSTHYLSTNVAHYKNPSDITSYKSNIPNSDLADAPVYKAIGYGVYMSSKTFPASRTFDTTEGVVD